MSLRDVMIQLIREQVPMMVVPATVLRVDKAAAVCDLQPVEQDAPELLDVRLRAVDNGTATGLISWPAVGSVVLVGLIDNDLNTAFVAACSEVEGFTLSTEKESLHTLLTDLVAEVRRLKFATNAGPTVQLLTDPAWALLASRIDNLLLP